MIIFSFNKCVSEAEARKVKKIYLITVIALYIVLGLVLGLISEDIYSLVYEGMREGNFGLIEQSMEKSEKFITLARPVSSLIVVFFFYITVWACLKLGMGKTASIFWGIVIFIPFGSLVAIIVILTRKFSPDKINPIT